MTTKQKRVTETIVATRVTEIGETLTLVKLDPIRSVNPRGVLMYAVMNGRRRIELGAPLLSEWERNGWL